MKADKTVELFRHLSVFSSETNFENGYHIDEDDDDRSTIPYDSDKEISDSEMEPKLSDENDGEKSCKNTRFTNKEPSKVCPRCNLKMCTRNEEACSRCRLLKNWSRSIKTRPCDQLKKPLLNHVVSNNSGFRTKILSTRNTKNANILHDEIKLNKRKSSALKKDSSHSEAVSKSCWEESPSKRLKSPGDLTSQSLVEQNLSVTGISLPDEYKNPKLTPSTYPKVDDIFNLQMKCNALIEYVDRILSNYFSVHDQFDMIIMGLILLRYHQCSTLLDRISKYLSHKSDLNESVKNLFVDWYCRYNNLNQKANKLISRMDFSITSSCNQYSKTTSQAPSPNILNTNDLNNEDLEASEATSGRENNIIKSEPLDSPEHLIGSSTNFGQSISKPPKWHLVGSFNVSEEQYHPVGSKIIPFDDKQYFGYFQTQWRPSQAKDPPEEYQKIPIIIKKE